MFRLVIDTNVSVSEIFDLEISQREGELAVAQVQVRAETQFAKIAGKTAKVMHDDDVLFVGVVQEYPSCVDKSMMTFQIISTYNPADFDKIIAEFKQSDRYNPMFDAEVQDVSQVTEAIPCRVRFSRISQAVGLSQICPNTPRYELSPEDYWIDSFKIKKARSAYSQINVSVSAEWIYAFSGITDLFPRIADAFPERRINSVTNIAKHWWKLMRSLPRSCYTIVNAKLQEDAPPNMCQCTEFQVDKQPVKVRRFWFKGILDVVWNYEQKIEETIRFSIKNPYASGGGMKTLNFRLGPPSGDSISFFKTEEGLACLKEAALRAFNHILASQRNIEIILAGSFDRLKKIEVGDAVAIKNRYLTAVGTVIQTFIKVNSEAKYVQLKIATSMHQGIKPPESDAFFKAHLDEWTPEGEASDEDIVEEILVENPPGIQIETARKMKFKSVTDLKHVLSRMPTKIRIKLKNLNTVKCLKREVKIGEMMVG